MAIVASFFVNIGVWRLTHDGLTAVAFSVACGLAVSAICSAIKERP